MKRDKISFRRAKLSGWLDILGLLASLVMVAGYVLVDIVKLSSLPEKLTDVWSKIEGWVESAFSGMFGDWLAELPQYPGVPYTVVFGVLALLFLIMAVCAFRQGNSVLKRGGCAFAGVLALLLTAAFGLLFAEHFISEEVALKWYLLAPCVFFLLQMILKFSAYARAY